MKKATNNNNEAFNAEALLNSMFNDVTNPENAVAVMELLDTYGLNWKVSKEPLLLPNGATSGFYGIVREDNQACFNTCKEDYVLFQNMELAEMLIRISEKTGYALHTGGSFKSGAKVYLQLKSPNSINGIGTNNDQVNGYLTGLNSHDGSALKWGETNITISCKNTFVAAGRELKNSARHTQNLKARVEEAIKIINGVVEQEKSLFDKYIQLSEIPVKRQHIAKIVKDITKVDTTLVKQPETVSTYSMNRSVELMECITKEMNQKGQTMWGLLSGVTNYTTHVMPAPKRENARLESLYTGSGFDINKGAFETVLSFMS